MQKANTREADPASTAQVPAPHPRHRETGQGGQAPAGSSRTAGIIAGAVASIIALATAGAFVSFSSTPDAGQAASSQESLSPGEARLAASHKFLDNWVDPDGRVVRRDQGNDTVSEGQAYGLLIAVGIGDESTFDAIWTWTREHLQRPDGLLAWRWAHGALIDDAPAADADLDAARALVRAGAIFNRPDLTAAGNNLGTSVMERLTAVTPRGRILLPGLWAVSGPDIAYNPSYASPAAFDVLRRSTGDPRWGELQLGARAVTSALLQTTPLPPDWARISADGDVQAQQGNAGQGPPAQYGYDAARLPIRFAESCTAEDIVLASAVRHELERANPLVAVLNLRGAATGSDQNAVSYVARAAARAAAGDDEQSRRDLQLAEDLNSLYPTYYGSAWLALGRDLLDSAELGGCPALGSHP